MSATGAATAAGATSSVGATLYRGCGAAATVPATTAGAAGITRRVMVRVVTICRRTGGIGAARTVRTVWIVCIVSAGCTTGAAGTVTKRGWAITAGAGWVVIIVCACAAGAPIARAKRTAA